MNGKEHYELLLEPLMEFLDKLTLDKDLKYSTIYEFLCYFVFPLLPNLSYSIAKNEQKQEQKAFGLYNPVLFIKNNEVQTKGYTLLNFIDSNLFDLNPQLNLSFHLLDHLLTKLEAIYSDDNSKSNVNLRFSLFVIYKRVLLLKNYAHLLNFNYGYSELEHIRIKETKEKNDNREIERETPIENVTKIQTEFNFHKNFILKKLEDLISTHEVVRKISIISLEMFRNKIDSESNEISNFFSFLVKFYKTKVQEIFNEFEFDLNDYFKQEEMSLLVKYLPSILSEPIGIKNLSNISEGFINNVYITAGNKKDLIIYAPRNSLFYFTSTITYYDGLINIYRYDPFQENDKFVLVGKDAKEQKIESDFTPFEITIFSYKPEIYKINLDNTFSWVNGKEIKYKCHILSLSNDTKPLEQHKFSLRYKLDFFKEQVLNKITEYVFFKYETFLGKNTELYAKKVLNFNYLNSYSSNWLLNFIGKKEQSSKLFNIFDNYYTVNKEFPLSLSEISEENKSVFIEKIKAAYTRVSSNNQSLSRGKKSIRLDKLASVDTIIRSYIKNVFVRVNMSQEELEDSTYKSEMCKFEDANDQFIFFNYYYLRQNKSNTLGDYFEAETVNNSNIIFMKFPLVDSCLIYYIHQLILENSKLPERVIYFHFDKTLTSYNYSVWNEGEIISNDFNFGCEEEKDDNFEDIIKRIIDIVNFREVVVDKKSKNKKKDSDEEDDDDEESGDEKSSKLKNWRIVCSLTGTETFIDETKTKLKSIITDLNSKYIEQKKAKTDTKKIKIMFKSVQFVCEMTNFMHCLELC